MQKAEARKIYLAKRQALSEADTAQLSERMSLLFFQHFDLREVQTLHIFLSATSKKEVQTNPIIRQVWKHYKHIQLLVPKVDLESGKLLHYYFTPTTLLHPSKFGIPEPQDAKLYEEKNIDLVILPLLCFDKRGYRLGYGKGHYDDFLALLPRQPLKIGLSFFDPVELLEDVYEGDIKLTHCISPQKLYQFA